MDSIKKLKDLFAKFPTVGPRTAGRFVYYLLKQPQEKTDELIAAIAQIKDEIKFCRLCFNPFEPHNNHLSDICPICQDPRRDKSLLCVVEKETDLLSIENTKKFTGFYFILGGTVGTMRNEDISSLRLNQLKSRIKEGNFSEIIVALNPTPEGQATSVLVESAIKETPVSAPLKITHLARGIPMGGELEYADEETLQSALDGRK